nr:unnamed protein product [Callosobruchus chinensis]CAH7727885.1 unnamed protein product [Callosobruchus chinensis]
MQSREGQFDSSMTLP